MKLIELKFNFSRFPLLASVKSSRFNDLTFQRFNALVLPVRPSQAQSKPVKPNQATPPPPGKQIGKETVKFLAIFDHLDGAPDGRSPTHRSQDAPARFGLDLRIRRVTIQEYNAGIRNQVS
jgi:hypothetical protein